MASARPRRLRFNAAVSLDGFIAGPNGEYDWITPDPSFDFAALVRQFDTLLLGRHTYELAITRGHLLQSTGMRIIVISTTLDPRKHPGATVVSSEIRQAVLALKAEPGKDIWLFGGGKLFRSLLDAELVDSIELAVMPTLLGGGIPLLPTGRRCLLRLDSSKALPSGILALTYSIAKRPPAAAKSRATSPRSKTSP